jgi:hypothetical protein
VGRFITGLRVTEVPRPAHNAGLRMTILGRWKGSECLRSCGVELSFCPLRLSAFAFLAFATLFVFAALFAFSRSFFQDGEVDFLFYRVDAVDDHFQLLAYSINFARMLSDDFARVFVVGVTIVDQSVQRD